MKPSAALLLVLLLAAAPNWAGAAGGGRAAVESIEIRIAESFPVQVFAILRGTLSDGCTTIADIAARGPLGDRFEIEITTQRPAGMMCTQALIPFERNLPLDVYGLPAGVYEVAAGDARATFTLRQYNTPQ